MNQNPQQETYSSLDLMDQLEIINSEEKSNQSFDDKNGEDQDIDPFIFKVI